MGDDEDSQQYSLNIKIYPQPKNFRGDDAIATMKLFESVAITNRRIYIPSPTYFAGSGVLIAVFFASIIGMFVFGRWSKKRQEATGQILPNLPQICLTTRLVPKLRP